MNTEPSNQQRRSVHSTQTSNRFQTRNRNLKLDKFCDHEILIGLLFLPEISSETSIPIGIESGTTYLGYILSVHLRLKKLNPHSSFHKITFIYCIKQFTLPSRASFNSWKIIDQYIILPLSSKFHLSVSEVFKNSVLNPATNIENSIESEKFSIL